MEFMCGRFAVTTDPALLAEKIKAIDESGASTPAEKDPPQPNYNVAPTTSVSTVVKRHSEPDDESTRRVRLMRWGLVPPWAKTADDGGPDTKKGPLLINARAETVTTSGAFRNSAKGKRCLVPMDGWYEWRPNGELASGKKAAKTPFYMYGADGELLYMAGLWSTWRPAKGTGAPSDVPPLLSCTIITTDSAGPLAEIHDRMPLTISKGDWDRWLDPDAPIDEGLLRGHGDLDRIELREVSRLVNSVRNNGPELIEPAEPEAEQATLL
jgi:putative SOS response-associated peptidase YedK